MARRCSKTPKANVSPPAAEPKAGEAKNLQEYICANPAKGFQPVPYYCSVSDSLSVYWDNEESYAKQVTSLLTIYIGSESGRVVGCQLFEVTKRICLTESRKLLQQLRDHLERTCGVK